MLWSNVVLHPRYPAVNLDLLLLKKIYILMIMKKPAIFCDTKYKL